MNKRILVVDDDKAILEVIDLILTGNNYIVETSPDGRIFNHLKTLPDLILLDMLLSGEDGREIIQKIRADSVMRDIPVIMFSAHPSAGDYVKKLGVTDFIEKPFDIEQFLKIVAKNLPS